LAGAGNNPRREILFTNCVTPPELEDQQLLAYLDDPEAHPETARHLEICSYCREKASALERYQKRLTSYLYRVTCPTPIELGEYHLRMLPASRMLIVRQHLSECPHCRREIDQLKEFMNTFPGMEGNPLQQAKWLVAQLVSARGGPGAASEPSFALRGAGEGPIVFETDGVVIMLDIQPAGEGDVNILGQVAADDQDRWTGALVELRQSQELQFSATLDDLGAFRFEGLVAGSKELRIIPKDGSLVVVSNFEVSV
jgi:hypothetical protein